MTTTIGSNRSAVKTKSNFPAKRYDDVDNMRQITQDLLRGFPFLETGPDVMYWLMATWGAESNWRLHFPRGNTFSSLHYTPSRPSIESTKGMGNIKSTGTLIGNGYQYSNVIQNAWNDTLVTPEIRENIKEGWYPHGISACMGTYHVKGCPNNTGEWRYYPEAVSLIGGMKLEVNPGQSIFQELFPTDDEVCRTRSIAAGMIIFNYKYRRALETTHRNNPVGAMQMAVGNFLGKFGSRDNNGISPEDRVRQLNATSGDLVSVLDYIGVRRRSDSTQLAELSPYLLNLQSKDASSRSATKVQAVAAAPATTNGGSNGVSKKKPGCELT